MRSYLIDADGGSVLASFGSGSEFNLGPNDIGKEFCANFDEEIKIRVPQEQHDGQLRFHITFRCQCEDRPPAEPRTCLDDPENRIVFNNVTANNLVPNIFNSNARGLAPLTTGTLGLNLTEQCCGRIGTNGTVTVPATTGQFYTGLVLVPPAVATLHNVANQQPDRECRVCLRFEHYEASANALLIVRELGGLVNAIVNPNYNATVALGVEFCSPYGGALFLSHYAANNNGQLNWDARTRCECQPIKSTTKACRNETLHAEPLLFSNGTTHNTCCALITDAGGLLGPQTVPALVLPPSATVLRFADLPHMVVRPNGNNANQNSLKECRICVDVTKFDVLYSDLTIGNLATTGTLLAATESLAGVSLTTPPSPLLAAQDEYLLDREPFSNLWRGRRICSDYGDGLAFGLYNFQVGANFTLDFEMESECECRTKVIDATCPFGPTTCGAACAAVSSDGDGPLPCAARSTNLLVTQFGDIVANTHSYELNDALAAHGIAVAATSPTSARQVVSVIDSAHPPCAAFSLGTPNEACGDHTGEGWGHGGRPGRPGANCNSFGHCLALTNDCDGDADHCPAPAGGDMVFEFCSPARVYGITLINAQPGTTVTFYDEFGGVCGEPYAVPALGENARHDAGPLTLLGSTLYGLHQYPTDAWTRAHCHGEPVKRMVVHLTGATCIDNIQHSLVTAGKTECTQDCDGYCCDSLGDAGVEPACSVDGQCDNGQILIPDGIEIVFDVFTCPVDDLDIRQQVCDTALEEVCCRYNRREIEAVRMTRVACLLSGGLVLPSAQCDSPVQLGALCSGGQCIDAQREGGSQQWFFPGKYCRDAALDQCRIGQCCAIDDAPINSDDVGAPPLPVRKRTRGGDDEESGDKDSCRRDSDCDDNKPKDCIDAVCKDGRCAWKKRAAGSTCWVQAGDGVCNDVGVCVVPTTTSTSTIRPTTTSRAPTTSTVRTPKPTPTPRPTPAPVPSDCTQPTVRKVCEDSNPFAVFTAIEDVETTQVDLNGCLVSQPCRQPCGASTCKVSALVKTLPDGAHVIEYFVVGCTNVTVGALLFERESALAGSLRCGVSCDDVACGFESPLGVGYLSLSETDEFDRPLTTDRDASEVCRVTEKKTCEPARSQLVVPLHSAYRGVSLYVPRRFSVELDWVRLRLAGNDTCGALCELKLPVPRCNKPEVESCGDECDQEASDSLSSTSRSKDQRQHHHGDGQGSECELPSSGNGTCTLATGTAWLNLYEARAAALLRCKASAVASNEPLSVPINASSVCKTRVGASVDTVGEYLAAAASLVGDARANGTNCTAKIELARCAELIVRTVLERYNCGLRSCGTDYSHPHGGGDSGNSDHGSDGRGHKSGRKQHHKRGLGDSSETGDFVVAFEECERSHASFVPDNDLNDAVFAVSVTSLLDGDEWRSTNLHVSPVALGSLRDYSLDLRFADADIPVGSVVRVVHYGVGASVACYTVNSLEDETTECPSASSVRLVRSVRAALPQNEAAADSPYINTLVALPRAEAAHRSSLYITLPSGTSRDDAAELRVALELRDRSGGCIVQTARRGAEGLGVVIAAPAFRYPREGVPAYFNDTLLPRGGICVGGDNARARCDEVQECRGGYCELSGTEAFSCVDAAESAACSRVSQCPYGDCYAPAGIDDERGAYPLLEHFVESGGATDRDWFEHASEDESVFY